MGLVGKRSECWGSDLNESTSLSGRVSYVIDRMNDLIPQAEGDLSNIM